MRREYHRWYSSHLGRDMELLEFGHAGARVLIFPTRMGRFFDYEEFGVLEGLRDRVEAGHLHLFCVDSIDTESFYSSAPPRQRIERHQQYENYLVHEVIPLTEQINPDGPLISHGCSLGGYHAVALAFRHPQLFAKVLALSGRYDLTQGVGDFPSLLDDYFDDTVYYFMPNRFMANLHQPEIMAELHRMHIVIVIGRDDPFLESNFELSRQLSRLEIEHELHVWDGRAHRPSRWQEMVRCYL